MSHLPPSPSTSSMSSPAPGSPTSGTEEALCPHEIVASAPGKVILHGEHSVVYGKMALAVSINLRTRVRIKQSQAPYSHLTVNLPDLRRRYSFKLDDLSNLRKKADLQPAPTSSPIATNANAKKSTLELNHNLVSLIKTHVSSLFPDFAEDMGIVAFLYLFLSILPDDHASLAANNRSGGNALSGLEAIITSEIPIGAGLGSSAAYSVAVAAALLSLKKSSEKSNNNNAENASEDVPSLAVKKQKLDGLETESKRDELTTVCKWAFMAEKILHGNPSGIDNTVCTFGGLLSYSHPSGMKPLEAPKNLRILLINTRVSRNTKRLVEKVKNRAVALPKVTSRILEAMDQISYAGLDTLNTLRCLSSYGPRRHSGSDDEAGISSEEELPSETKIMSEEEGRLYQTLEELIDTNQGLLSSLGVSHPSLDAITTLCSAHGMHAKLTGAGGGGFAFALVTPHQTEEQVNRVRSECAQAGFDCWETSIGGQGVVYSS